MIDGIGVGFVGGLVGGVGVGFVGGLVGVSATVLNGVLGVLGVGLGVDGGMGWVTAVQSSLQ